MSNSTQRNSSSGSLIRWAGLAALIAIVFYVGVMTGKPDGSGILNVTISDEANGDATTEESSTTWTCAMHPQVRMPEAGLCPLCAMDLIPMTQSLDDSESRRLVMSPADQKLAEIETSLVERKFVDAKIRMVGKIEYDETLVRNISSYVPGRIDRLFVNFTGIEVKKGDHLAEIYSPDLLTAQEELIEAARRVGNSGNESSKFLRDSDRRALESAREKLRLLGFSDRQIASIEERGTSQEHMVVTSPLGGIVVHKSLNEGDYVQTGSHIYTVADLSKVWVKLDAYESDLPWIHFGQHVDIQAEAYPGEHFDGIIAFIGPTLDPVTRTVKIRVNVENSDGRLKPGIFVKGTVHSRVASGGRVMDPGLAGKWISPMHPEVVEDGPGDCRVCGMQLIRAEELGYVNSTDDAAKPLVVPASAVMKTGNRAITYISVPEAPNPTFEGREVILGPRAGDYYLVEAGLRAGDRVVTNGNFNIDSALQIQAKPSMLSMEAESPGLEGDIATFRIALSPLYEAYLNAQAHLAGDQLAEAQSALEHVGHLLDDIDMTLLENETHDFWMEQIRSLRIVAADFAAASEIAVARESFDEISRVMIDLQSRFGHAGDAPYMEVHCPMAFDRGASWLQRVGTVANPFYGAEMLDCGTVVTEHAPAAGRATGGSAHAGHNH